VAEVRSRSEDIWFELEHPGRRRPQRRRVVIPVACLAVALVAVGILNTVGNRSDKIVRVDAGPAAQRVMSALGATVAATRWDMTFRMSLAPPVKSGEVSPAEGITITGHGTTNVDPFAMVAYANVGQLGAVTTKMNSTEVWEFGGGNYGAQPGSTSAGPGASIAGFAPSVVGTLGPEEGAVAMMGLGSATGYLDLVRSEIVAASATGTGVVDGVSVTYYRVSVDPTKLLGEPGTTPQEAAAVQTALQVLNGAGFNDMTDTVAIDGEGHIRDVTEIVSFADGGVVTSETTLSDFGCAATVVLPGVQSPTTTAPPCPAPAG
jgi:hypothetical protein